MWASWTVYDEPASHNQKTRDNKTCLRPTVNRTYWILRFRKQTTKTRMGQSLAALLFTWQSEVGWPGRPMNLTDRHEYKVTCWVNWCTSLPHSLTYVMMSHIQTETTASYVRHTIHILTACVLDRYSFVSLIDVLSLDGSFLVPSSMYSLVTKAQTTPKLQTDTVLSVN
jgi:hypothetical protein